MTKRALNIYSSNGACPNKSAYRDFTPCNTVYVFGDPGERVVVSVASGGNFTGYSSQTREIIIGTSGYESLDISSINDGPLSVYAYSQPGGNRNATTTTVFFEPHQGSSYIDLYSNTTGVPSDGVSTAKVYLYISSLLDSIDTNYVQVAAMNNSSIINCNNESTGQVPIPPSGQVEIAITSTYPGIKKVYFHVKGYSLITPLSVDIEFIDIGAL